MGSRGAALLQCEVDEAAHDAIAVDNDAGDPRSDRIVITPDGRCSQFPPLDGTLPLKKGGERTSRTMSDAGSRQPTERREVGGGRGIRTPGTLSGTVVFKTTAIDHSAIPPRRTLCQNRAVSRESSRSVAMCHRQCNERDDVRTTQGQDIVTARSAGRPCVRKVMRCSHPRGILVSGA